MTKVEAGKKNCGYSVNLGQVQELECFDERVFESSLGADAFECQEQVDDPDGQRLSVAEMLEKA